LRERKKATIFLPLREGERKGNKKRGMRNEEKKN
jgi:hypothetical protein